MPESANKAAFKLPPELRVLQGLPLKDKLKGIFSPSAKQNVVLLDEQGHWITARVNAWGTFLKGSKLIEFLEDQKATWLELAYLGGNYYRLTALMQAPPEFSPTKQTQLSFEYGIKEDTHPAKEVPKPSKTTPLSAKSTQRAPSFTKTTPLSVESAQANSHSVKRTPHPLQKISRSGSGGKSVKASQAVPPKAPHAASPQIPKMILPRTSEAASPETPPMTSAKTAQAASPATPPMLPAVKSPLIPSVTSPEILMNTSPVKVFLFPEDDASLLADVGAGRFSPADDLYLRRQALALAVHPGFETLMALNAVRDVQPLDYQLQTVRHVLMRLRGRALLCDEVGMGKTVEAGLVTLEYILRGLVRRVLVLTPPSLVEQWQEEMQRKFNLDFVIYDSLEFRAHPNPWEGFPRIIASIDTAKRANKQEQVLAVTYDLVIVDEAHHLKNQRSQAYQLVSRLKKKYILLLTATPVENDLGELFNLITLLSPGQLETSVSFKRKYITAGDPLKPKNAETLKQLIREVMVRNRRSETGAIAGGRSADIIRIELTPDEMAFYRRLTGFIRGYYQVEGGQTQAGVSAFVLKILQREAGSSIEAVLPTLEKMAASVDYPESLRRLLAALARQAQAIPRRSKVEALLQLLPKIQGKVIIFTGFSATQRYLAQTLRAAGRSVAELHSGLRRQEKEEQVRLFAGEADILVSTETGSEGRNLQFCHQMINYDLPWNPMRIEQRIGRIHRLGQDRNVRIYNLSATDTIEAHLLELLDAKINMFQLVVGELDMILGDLTEKRDFEDLLMDIWARSENDASLNAEMKELGDRLAAAREHYLAVKELDERLLGELAPEESE